MNRSVFFLNHLAQTTPSPFLLDISHAKGSYIYTKENKAYLDMIAGVAVNNIGHNHPKVIQAIKNQVDQHLHVMVYGEYIQDSQLNLAANLNKILPAPINSHYVVNSGTEANEGAVKLAKRYTNRHKVIAYKKSYHGSTHGSLSFSGNEEKKFAFRPLLPEVHHITFNSMDDLNEIDERTACVLIEPIQGDAGVRIPSVSYMQALRKKCSATGTLLIVDEVQTGMGRTGKMFAFEHFNIVPDIVVTGKALGGGMSIGCFSSSKEIMLSLTSEPMLGHITTFGGHPVNCAAAAATIDVMLDDKIVEDVDEKGAFLEGILQQSPLVKEIRRKGLMFAIDLENFEQVEQVVQHCMKNGLISFWFLSCPASFRLSPPLNISFEELEKAGQIILEAMENVTIS